MAMDEGVYVAVFDRNDAAAEPAAFLGMCPAIHCRPIEDVARSKKVEPQKTTANLEFYCL
jgi:hypothetical protein